MVFPQKPGFSYIQVLAKTLLWSVEIKVMLSQRYADYSFSWFPFSGSRITNQVLFYCVVFQVHRSCVEFVCMWNLSRSFFLHYYLITFPTDTLMNLHKFQKKQISSTSALWLAWGKWAACITITWAFYTSIFFVPQFSKFSQGLKVAWPKIMKKKKKISRISR